MKYIINLPLPGWEGQGIALLSSIFPSPSAQETTYTLMQYLAILPSHLDNMCLFTTVLGIVLRNEAISVWPSEVTNSSRSLLPGLADLGVKYCELLLR